MGLARAFLVPYGRFVKHTVSGPLSRREKRYLVHLFRVRDILAAGYIVSFIDNRLSLLINVVTVRGILLDGHQDDRVRATQSEIHSVLETGIFSAAHLDIRNDLVNHGNCHYSSPDA